MRSLKSWFEREPRIPYVAQLATADCGAACLAMVLGMWGRETDLEELHAATGMTSLGINAMALLDAAGRFGLVGRPVQADLDQLELLPRGSILHWEFRHFVVFDRVTRKGVRVVDPSAGVREISLEHFSRSFTGVALLFEPGESFVPAKRRRHRLRRYGALLLESKGMLARIIGASLLLQLFALLLPALLSLVLEKIVPAADRSLLTMAVAGAGLVVLFQWVVLFLRSELLGQLRVVLDSRLTTRFLDHLLRLPFPFFQARAVGDLMARIDSITTVRESLTNAVVTALIDGTLVVFFLGLLLVASPLLAGVVLVLAALQGLVFWASRRSQAALMARELEVVVAARNYEVELFSGVQTLKGMGIEDRALQHWSGLYANMLNVTLQRGTLQSMSDAFAQTLRLASPLVVLLLGCSLVLDGQLSLARMLALNALATGFLTPIANLVATSLQMQQVSLLLSRIDDVLNAQPEQQQGELKAVPRLTGRIEVRDVKFQFASNLPMVVDGVTLSIEPGQFVAIVGPSGAGKSTLAHLLLGLYLPTNGEIAYDGHLLSGLHFRDLRRQLGVVLQTPALFRGDIRRNIALTDPLMPMERVVEAAKRAQIHHEIEALPMQYETVLSEMGASLSGGQRQRLALARALAAEPAMLLLDEATNALDSKTERAVQTSIEALKCTRVVIAHRLSTISHADLVLVMSAGRIVERGTHAELLALGGLYSSMVEAQRLEQTGA